MRYICHCNKKPRGTKTLINQYCVATFLAVLVTDKLVSINDSFVSGSSIGTGASAASASVILCTADAK